MASATVKVWTHAGQITVKVNPVTRPILQTLPRSGGSYTARDAGQVETLTANAVTQQAAK